MNRQRSLLSVLVNKIHRCTLIFSCSVFCLGMTFTTSVNAQQTIMQEHDEIRQNIEQFVKQQFPKSYSINTQVGKIDPHLQLSACEQRLETFYPVGARKSGVTSVGIRCIGAKGWTIYLPVNIRIFGETVVSKRALARGAVLHKSDLAVAKRDLSRVNSNYYTSIEQLEGMRLRRSLAQGSILQSSFVKQRHMVKRGELITILAESQGITIRVKGKAMMDGFRGQSIRIRNVRSKRDLQGEVVGPGTVRVNL